MNNKALLSAILATLVALVGVGVWIAVSLAQQPGPAVASTHHTGQPVLQQPPLQTYEDYAAAVRTAPTPQAPPQTTEAAIQWRELTKNEKPPELYVNVPEYLASRKWHWQTNQIGEWRLVLLQRDPAWVTYAGSNQPVEFGWRAPTGKGEGSVDITVRGGNLWRWETNDLGEWRWVRYSRAHGDR